ncbi:MAG: hypothetical protein UIM53_03245 [Acutalibacteraceae bacterium]|nr:hypothetical protein [Acutalibacteraceae bacterium]
MKKKLFTLALSTLMLATTVMPVYATDNPMTQEEFMQSYTGQITSDSAPTETEVVVAEVSNEKGTVIINLDIPESMNFKQNVVVQLYNRKTGTIVEVPVYLTNNWRAQQEIPTGSYMVYNALAGGDDGLNPEYLFEVGTLFEVRTGNTTPLSIKMIVEEETPVVETKPETIETEVEPVQEEKTLLQIFIDFIKKLVLGPNLFILLTLAGAYITIWIIQKKKRS